MRTVRPVITIAATIILALTTVSPVAAAPATYRFEGPQLGLSCLGLHEGFEVWPDVTTEYLGSVTYRISDTGMLLTTVSIKGGVPNAEYPVYVSQEIGDCNVVDGTLVTDKRGNGKLRMSEPIDPTAIAARAIFSAPDWEWFRSEGVFVYPVAP